MHRIVVIGGNGFLGSRVVRALAQAPGVDVEVAGRRGPVTVDLSRPASFEALSGADVIVDVSSSHAAAPDALAAFCLERGLTLLEASSDRVVVERLLDAHRGRDAAGALVLGAGIFTGLSNAMAGAVARALPGADSVAIGVASSPFSGAGEGTIDLMADALAVPTRTIRGGLRVDDPVVSAGPTLPFPGGSRRTLHMPFAEPSMVHASTGVPNVAMYMAPKPALLALAFRALPAAMLRHRAFQGFLRLYFRVLRRVLLRRVATAVELVVQARRGAEQHACTLRTADGMEAGGVAIAATALSLAAKRPRGTQLVDEVVPLEEMLSAMRALAPTLALEVG